ncbi:hypothetical protein [Pseudomonas aeruginosa]|uniref:hypothetical protein n=1 Tax=Pseudomonas aeruginosa TaxID=287 RepID=UPI001AAEF54B|nr:hypothetical protein [Pseudomonas aeruginosa]MBO2834625.1 hypothetical protein [Pseudomonas aeruginosa]
MNHADKMKKAARISDLELYELVVAMYPEKFGARDEQGDDLWDEVMEFVEDDLVGELLCTEEGLRELLGRVLLLTHPIQSGITGKLYHALGVVEVIGDKVQMQAAAKSEISTVEPVPQPSTEMRAGLEWLTARCKALQSQGFPRTRHDVLIKDLEGCLSCDTEKTKALEPGLRWAIEWLQALQAHGATHSTHDSLIKDLETRLSLIPTEGPERFPCWNCHLPVSLEARGEADGQCPHCSAELDLEDWPKRQAM